MIRVSEYLMLGAVTVLLCGCGGLQVREEEEYYQAELDAQAITTLRNCLAGERTSMSQHRAGATPDCFDLVVKQSPKRVGVRNGTAQLRDGDKQVPPESDDAYAYIDQFALMALFSKMVYHRFQDEQDRSSEMACMDDTGRHPLLSLYDKDSTNGRWRLWDEGRTGCHAERGLFMETYVYYPTGAGTQGNGFTRATIVFRGTENGQTQRTADWGTNLAPAFGFKPEQYVAASAHVDNIVAELRSRHPGPLHIYAAGHSLGGGLAQMAAYWNSGIDAAYAFNSTPITGWTWIHRERRKAGTLSLMNSDPAIYRISQRSEVLQPMRAFATAVTSDHFGRSDFDFDFRIDPVPRAASREQKIAASVEQHDIGLLACHMAARVVLGHAKTGSKAAFDYTPEMALKALWQSDKLANDSEGNASLCSRQNMLSVRNALCKEGNPSAVCRIAPPESPGAILAQGAQAADPQ